MTIGELFQCIKWGVGTIENEWLMWCKSFHEYIENEWECKIFIETKGKEKIKEKEIIKLELADKFSLNQ